MVFCGHVTATKETDMPVSAIHPQANHPEPVRCSPALAQAARQAVMGAAAASFPSEPLLDPALSRLVSTCSSIVKRHGPLVKSAIAEALVEGGLDVWQRIKVPFTRTALAFVASSDYALNRDRLLTFDPNDIAGHFDADVLAVDDPGAWACALSGPARWRSDRARQAQEDGAGNPRR